MANGRVLGHDGIWLLAVTRHPAQELCGVEGGRPSAARPTLKQRVLLQQLGLGGLRGAPSCQAGLCVD
ncbi:hypothetical protein AK812_SmicGene44832 [Symbiodinium microadriaticum]|uniref:Uncharacterized protein n=1 Tax=Symbiodinium microadriaticum TaxID=2951 RepID=A0A1Q9BXI9_SYMMI|nr:hypothetical protein AK812_SmicGene44832 [Symbiodinium microadriaticum]